VSGQEAIREARRRLGGQLAAWRRKAGLTQREVAHLAGYARSAISHAEISDPASRELIEAADRAGARARAARLAEADSTPPPPAAVSTAETPCPWCARRVAVRLAVSLLPAVPAS
jgi:DNA-binding XRE family transcriptional regulator